MTVGYNIYFIHRYIGHRGEVGSGAPGEQSTQINATNRVNGEWSCGPVTNAERGDWSRRWGVGGFTHHGLHSHQEGHSREDCGRDFWFHLPRGTSAVSGGGGGGRGDKTESRQFDVGFKQQLVTVDRCGDLGADAQMAVGDELWLLVAVLLFLQVGVEHANGNTRQSHHEAQDLPGLGYKRRNILELN